MTKMLTVMVAAGCIGSAAGIQEKNAATLVAEANKALADGDHTSAHETYRAVEAVLPESPELAYNLGVVNYLLGNYTGARDDFNRALLTRDVPLEARTKFNLGNVAYTLAQKKMGDPPEAIDLLKAAIGHYRDAIELDPADKDACINIELAQRLIRDLLEKLSRQREGQRQQQDDQRKPQEDSEGQPEGGQQGEQDDLGAEPQQAESGEQAGDHMTPQEVERLLQAVRDKERQRQDEVTRRRHARRTPVEKDW